MNHVEACPACGDPAGTPRPIVTKTVSLGALSLRCELIECPSCAHGYLSPQPADRGDAIVAHFAPGPTARGGHIAAHRSI